MECVEVTSPGGECRVVRRRMDRETINFCVVRRPRNWYSNGGRRAFRGLQVQPDGADDPVHIIYVIDCERFDGDEDYQEHVFRELHGMLGEGKGQFKRAMSLNLHLLNPSDTEAVLDRLKISEHIPPRAFQCSFYAGPVVFVVQSHVVPPQPPVITIGDDLQNSVVEAFRWLMKQPSSWPHWDVPDDALLCSLHGDGRGVRHYWTSWRDWLAADAW